MKRVAVIVLAFALMGCAQVQLTAQCPAASTGVGFALAGSTVGNQVLSMLGNMGQTAGLMAHAATAASPTTSATMTYSYLPIFGADSGSLTCVMPPQQTVVVTSPPASIVTH